MRPVPFAVTVLALITAVLIVAALWRSGAKREQPVAVPAAPARDGTTASRPERAPAPGARPAEVPAPKPVVTLEPGHLQAIRGRMDRWDFPPNDGTYLRALRDAPQVTRVAAEWVVRSAFRARAELHAPALPPEATALTIDNGHVLWARSVRGDEREMYQVELLSGLSTRLPRAAVSREERVSRDTYIERTKSSYSDSIRALDLSSPAEIERGAGLALRRGDLTVVDRLYGEWLRAAGPLVHAGLLERAAGEELRAAAATLRIGDAVRETRARTTTGETTALEARLPVVAVPLPSSLRELSGLLEKIQEEARAPIGAVRRQEILDRLAAWEDWLDMQRAEKIHEEEVTRLARDLQFLRLDVLKGSGF